MYYRSPPIIASVWRPHERPYRPRDGPIYTVVPGSNPLFPSGSVNENWAKSFIRWSSSSVSVSHRVSALLKVPCDVGPPSGYFYLPPNSKGRRSVTVVSDSLVFDTPPVPLENLLHKLFSGYQPFRQQLASASVCARLETRSSSIVTGLLFGSAIVLPTWIS